MTTTNTTNTHSPCDEEVTCVFCLEAGSGEALQRDCSCRGSAGYVHRSCFATYAADKSKSWDGRSWGDFCKPWTTCLNCHQDYQNKFGVAIAKEFSTFVHRQYPSDLRKRVEALSVKLLALHNTFDTLGPKQKKETEVTAKVILFLVGQMKEDAPPLPIRVSDIEAVAYTALGVAALKDETEDSSKRAVMYFENQLEVFKAIDDDEKIIDAKHNIAIAKSMHDFFALSNSIHDKHYVELLDRSNANSKLLHEELLKRVQEKYEFRVAQLGKEHALSINAGHSYATGLANAGHKIEAVKLLTKLIAISKQVHGSDHNTTKSILSKLQQMKN